MDLCMKKKFEIKINVKEPPELAKEFSKIINYWSIAEVKIYEKFKEMWKSYNEVYDGNEEYEEYYMPFYYEFKKVFNSTLLKDLITLMQLKNQVKLESILKVNHLIYYPELKMYSLDVELCNETIDNIFRIPIICTEFMKERNSKWLRAFFDKKMTIEEYEIEKEKNWIKEIKQIKTDLRRKSGGLKKISKLQIQKVIEKKYGIKRSTFYESTKNIDIDSI
jgi:hypothetical protein